MPYKFSASMVGATLDSKKYSFDRLRRDMAYMYASETCLIRFFVTCTSMSHLF